jgi:coproporphyrinogen III oxidase
MQDFRQAVSGAFRAVQDSICAFLDAENGKTFREDAWDYAALASARAAVSSPAPASAPAAPSGGQSGGGVTRTWDGGGFLEKGGVAFSAIEGSSLPPSALAQLSLAPGARFFATGVSLVLHPRNPHVPTIHMNVRYFEAGEAWWFGGGIDLTPYYPVESQVVGFHRALRGLCRAHGRDHEAWKRACDEYFFLKHRGEARGVGGIFFDHLRGDRGADFAFAEALGLAFPDLYRPFLAGRGLPYGEAERQFQLHRRSRYAEFNLLYDRGTLFGLQSGGRTESILMSMPPLARWEYGYQPPPGSPEERLTAYFLKPRDWAGRTDRDAPGAP